jgi:hypothetical protein
LNIPVDAQVEDLKDENFPLKFKRKKNSSKVVEVTSEYFSSFRFIDAVPFKTGFSFLIFSGINGIFDL